MSIRRVVQVGAITAQATIDAAAEGPGDTGAALLRIGVLELLRLNASQLDAPADEAGLADAYRAWLDIAVVLYSTGDETQVREYMRRGALLGAELELAFARGDGTLATPASVEEMTS